MKTMMVIGLFMLMADLVSAQTFGGSVESSSPITHAKEDEIRILPTPLASGAYFWIKVPDREALKGVEVMDSTGERSNKTDITFSKMGLYMPKLKPGTYHLKIYLEEEILYKKVLIE